MGFTSSSNTVLLIFLLATIRSAEGNCTGSINYPCGSSRFAQDLCTSNTDCDRTYDDCRYRSDCTDGCSCSLNDYDESQGLNGLVKCVGTPDPCSSYTTESSCERYLGCNWEEGPTPAPPPPTEEPTAAPTAKCDRPFEERQEQSTEGAMGLHFADFNGDGLLDRVGRDSDGNLTWHEQLADGSYVKRSLTTERNDVRDVAAEDMNGDGYVDIVYAESGSRRIGISDYAYWGSVGWFKNRGDGTFEDFREVSPYRGVRIVRVVDLDGDGLLDIVSAYGIDRRQYLVWYRNNGDETFAEGQTIDYVTDVRSIFVEADANGDGRIDILTSTAGITGSRPSRTAWYMNNGDGTFTEIIVVEENYFDLSIAADLNGDGMIDVVGARTDEAYWYENKGDGSYEEHMLVLDLDPNIKPSSGGLITADINGDGLLDIVMTGLRYTSGAVTGRGITWFENKGNSVFEGHYIETDSPFSSGLVVRDMNRDGFLDIVREDYWLETLGYCFGTSLGTPAPAPSESLPTPVPTDSQADSDSLVQLGYFHQRDSSNGWLTRTPEMTSDGDLTFDSNDGVSDLMTCAEKCRSYDAKAGSWNSRFETCFCYSSLDKCLEPCIEEIGLEFSSTSFSEFEYCEQSFCDYYADEFVDYCEQISYDATDCQAKIANGQQGDSNSSPAAVTSRVLASVLVFVAVFFL